MNRYPPVTESGAGNHGAGHSELDRHDERRYIRSGTGRDAQEASSAWSNAGDGSACSSANPG